MAIPAFFMQQPWGKCHNSTFDGRFRHMHIYAGRHNKVQQMSIYILGGCSPKKKLLDASSIFRLLTPLVHVRDEDAMGGLPARVRMRSTTLVYYFDLLIGLNE